MYTEGQMKVDLSRLERDTLVGVLQNHLEDLNEAVQTMAQDDALTDADWLDVNKSAIEEENLLRSVLRKVDPDVNGS